MRNHKGKSPLYHLWDEKSFAYDGVALHWQAKLFYRALLQNAWHVPTRPDLPDDDSALAAIIGCPPETWQEYAAVIRAFFKPLEINGTKVLRQGRLYDDWQALETVRQRRADAANKRWADEAKPSDAKKVASSQTAVDNIRAAVIDARAKVPSSANVLRLLGKFSEEQILQAWDEYIDTLNEDSGDLSFAEKRFFEDGGCEAGVRAIDLRQGGR